MKPDWFGHLTTEHSNFAAHFLAESEKRDEQRKCGTDQAQDSECRHQATTLRPWVSDQYRSGGWRREATHIRYVDRRQRKKSIGLNDRWTFWMASEGSRID